jgi:integrase
MYIAALYDAGRPRSVASNAVYGVLFYRQEARGHMFISTRLLKGWLRITPSVSHPPLTWPLAVLIAATMARRSHIDAAMATLVGFDCFLRISEYVGFLISDLALPTDPRLGSTMAGARAVLCIRHAKTAKPGQNQSVEIYNNEVTALLTRYVHRRRTRQRAELTSPLFPLQSEDEYRHKFKQAINDLGIQSVHFVPHSLRHGGATHALRMGYDINTVMQRGRWRSTSSADLYLQQANAARLGTQLNGRVHESAQALANNFANCMSILLFPEDHTVSVA